MGIFSYIWYLFDKKSAGKDTIRNRRSAINGIEQRKEDIVKRYSQYGDVVELKDGVNLLGKYYSNDCGQGLGYDDFYFSSDYEEHYAVHETDYTLTGYSGTISSSGSVNISPNYSSVSYSEIKKRKNIIEKYYYIKPVEKGKKDTVLELEKTFFKKSGDMYCRIKNNRRLDYPSEKIDPKLYFGRIVKLRCLISIICLLVYALLCVYLYKAIKAIGGINEVLNGNYTVDELWVNYTASNLPIITLVIGAVVLIPLLIIYHKRQDGKYIFDLEDSTCSSFIKRIFIITPIFAILLSHFSSVFSFYEIFFNISLSLIFAVMLIACNLICLVIALIFFIRCARKGDKNVYTRMWRLLKNPKRIAELEQLAAEIDSYTQSHICYSK